MHELVGWVTALVLIAVFLWYKDTHWDPSKVYQGEADMEVALAGAFLLIPYFLALIARLVFYTIKHW